MRRRPDSEHVYQLIGDRLRQCRRSTRLSQEQVGRKCGYTRATVANVEAGHQRPTIHTLIRLATALETDYRSLLPDPREIGAPTGQESALPESLKEVAEAAGPSDTGKVVSFMQKAVNAKN